MLIPEDAGLLAGDSLLPNRERWERTLSCLNKLVSVYVVESSG